MNSTAYKFLHNQSYPCLTSSFHSLILFWLALENVLYKMEKMSTIKMLTHYWDWQKKKVAYLN